MPAKTRRPNHRSRAQILGQDLRRDWQKYAMILIPFALVFVFSYMPMAGIQIAFKDFSIRRGIWGSEWVGLDNFKRVFGLPRFSRVVWNTLYLNLLSMVVKFPATILFALLLNEMRRRKIQRIVQTVSYLPHFLSVVIIYGIVYQLCAPRTGMLNQIFLSFCKTFGIDSAYVTSGGLPYLTKEAWWIGTYTISGIWSGIGWGSIIYLSAITAINPELYEAAEVDGANRWVKMANITLPGIRPTIVLLLILEMGGLFSIGFEKPYVFGNAIVTNVAEVISVFVYHIGLGQSDFDTATVVGLAQSVVGAVLVVITNQIANWIGDDGIW